MKEKYVTLIFGTNKMLFIFVYRVCSLFNLIYSIFEYYVILILARLLILSFCLSAYLF